MLFGFLPFKLLHEIKDKYTDYNIIVHAHNAASLGLFNTKCKYGVVCTLHGKSIWKKECFRKRVSDWLNTKIIVAVMKSGGSVVAVSEQTSRYFSSQINADIPVVYNGIKKEAKKRLGFEKSFVIGHVGGVSYSKGWDIALSGVGEFIRLTNADALFVSAGKISIAKDEMENLVSKINMKDRFVNYGLINDAGNTFIPNLDLLLLPSISEGLPMSIIEALSYGVPVIATDVGGITEIVYDNIDGFIVERNAEQIAERIRYLYSNPQIYNEMCKNSTKIYNDRFTSQIMADKYYELYGNVIINQKGRS